MTQIVHREFGFGLSARFGTLWKSGAFPRIAPDWV